MDFIKNNNLLDQIFDLQYAITYVKFENLLKSHTPVKREQRDLEEILKDKKIVVCYRERDFIYHKEGEKQFVQILAEEFANYLGVKLEFVVIPSFNDYWKNSEGEIIKDSSYSPEMFSYFDLACDMFAPLDWRKRKVDLINIYQTDYAIIAKRGTRINSINDLNSLKGVTAKNTLYMELLADRGINNLMYSKINDMVPNVISGQADYTLIYNAFLYPKLQSKLSLGTTDISWAVRYNQPQLKKALEQFISQSTKNGLLKALSSISKGEINTNIEDYLKTYYLASQKGTLPHIVVDAKNGLPQEDVNCMYQDIRGFLWFGTQFGLVKYSGKKMRKYYLANGLISNIINDVIQAPNGNMLVATDKGLSIISGTNITNIPYSNSINQIYIGSKSRIWLICNNGIATLEKGEIHLQSHLKSDKFGTINSFQETPKSNAFILASSKGLFLINGLQIKTIIDNPVNCAFIDSEGSLWYNTLKGIFYCQKGVVNIGNAIQINKSTGILLSQIQNIKEGSHGVIWLQNTHHLYQVTSVNQKALAYATGKDLINNVILSSLQDREQNLWIGYSGGLQKIRNNKSLRNFFPKKLDYYISSIEMDNQNNIWITSNNGTFFYSNVNGELTKKTEIAGISFVRQIPEGSIVIINEKGLYFPDSNDSLKLYSEFDFTGLTGAYISTKGVLYLWTEKGGIYKFKDFKSKPVNIKTHLKASITNLIEFNGNIYVAINNQLFILEKNQLKMIYQHSATVSGIGHSYDKIYFASQGKIFSLDDATPVYSFIGDIEIKNIIPSQNRSYVWISTNKGVFYFNASSGQQFLNITSSDGLQGNEIVNNGISIDKSGILWILTYHGISNYNLCSLTKVKYAPKCYLSAILVNGEAIDSSTFEFAYNHNDFSFTFSGIFFSNEKSVKYHYYLRGSDKSSNFIRLTKENTIYYDNLEPGEYELVYRAKGEDDIWSESKSYKFIIDKALWDTWLFRIVVFLLVIGGITGIYNWRLRRIRIQKQHLENLVEKRTEDLVEANKMVTQKNKEITSSIHYAERIQQSLLPKQKLFNKRFSDHFIIFMPRDIVSGDFFWAYEKEDVIYVSVVDCTGHGVPGAFMSMLGMTFLKEIAVRHKQPKPGDMLNSLRNEVIAALQQKGRLGEAKDGMDMSLISINTKTMVLEYAGANNSIYMLRQNSDEIDVQPKERMRQRSDILFEIASDKMPIAIYDKMDNFLTVRVQLQKGDMVYLFSDGYPDQFGGPKNKKLMYPRLRKVIETHHQDSMETQKTALMKLLEEWKGTENQVDDITLIGLKV